jgi:hypothetical protein
MSVFRWALARELPGFWLKGLWFQRTQTAGVVGFDFDLDVTEHDYFTAITRG